MQYFMEVDLNQEIQEIEIEGIDKFKYPKGTAKEGEKVPWVLKPITTEHMNTLRKQNTSISFKKHVKKTNVDSERLTLQMMIDTIVFPNFKDKVWLEKYKLLDPVDLLQKVLSFPGDFTRISEAVVEVNGLNEDEIEDIKEAKN